MNEVTFSRNDKPSTDVIASKPLFNKQLKRNCKSIIRDLDEIGKVDHYVSLCINALKLNPQQRTSSDLSHITSFLEKTDLAKKLTGESLSRDSLQQILVMCGTEMMYHYSPSNKILFRIGDKGNNFYIIIQGRVEILKPVSYQEKMTGFEYFNTLLYLYNKHEIYLLNETIEANYKLFPIDNTVMPLLRIILLDIMLDGYQLERNLKRKTFLDVIHSCNIDIISESTINLKEDDDDIIEDIEKWLDIYLLQVKYIKHDDYKDLKNKTIKHELTIFKYRSFLELDSGSFFGDAALDKKTKRNATIKTMEDTHFCSLDIKNYNNFLYTEKRRLVNHEISFLVNSFFFKKISPTLFERKYFNFFIHEELYKGDYLFHESEPVDCIFFVQNGQIELSTTRNVFEIHCLISYLGQILSENKSQEAIENMKNDINHDMIEELSKRTQYSLFTVNGKDTFGAECFFFGINFLYTGRVISERAKIYKIYLKDLLELINAEPSAYDSLQWNSKNKIEALKMRLASLKKTSLGMVDQKIKENKTIQQKAIEKIDIPKTKYRSPGLENKQMKVPLSFNQTVSILKQSTDIDAILPSILFCPKINKPIITKNQSDIIAFQQFNKNNSNNTQSINLKKNHKSNVQSKSTIESSHFGILSETRLLTKLQKDMKKNQIFSSTDLQTLGNSKSQEKTKIDNYSLRTNNLKAKLHILKDKKKGRKTFFATEVDKNVVSVVSMCDNPIDQEEIVSFKSSKTKFSGKYFQKRKRDYKLFKDKIIEKIMAMNN